MGLPQKRHKNEDGRDVKADIRSGEQRERLISLPQMAQILGRGILTAKNGENPKQIPKDGKSGMLKMTAEKALF